MNCFRLGLFLLALTVGPTPAISQDSKEISDSFHILESRLRMFHDLRYNRGLVVERLKADDYRFLGQFEESLRDFRQMWEVEKILSKGGAKQAIYNLVEIAEREFSPYIPKGKRSQFWTKGMPVYRCGSQFN